jgi:hypothetical protein
MGAPDWRVPWGYVQKNPKAIAFHQSGAHYKVAVCGARGGKTVAGGAEFLICIYLHDLPNAIGKPYNPHAPRNSALWYRRRPRLHYWVVAPDYALTDEALRVLLDLIDPGLIEHYDAQKRMLWLKPDILIEFKSAENKGRKLVSVGLNGLWLEEAALMHGSVWKGRLQQRLADKGGWLIVTTTPLGKNWLYTDLAEPAMRGVAGMEFFTWKTLENTNNPILQREVARARELLPASYFRREYEAAFDAFEGQVFPEWDPAKYVREQLAAGMVWAKMLGGADWGSTNPGALAVVGFTPLGFKWVLDEVYERGKLVEKFWGPQAARLTNRWNVSHWICDPAEPDNLQRLREALTNTRAKVLKHRNFESAEHDEHARSVRAGIRQMSIAINDGKLLTLGPRTPNFQAEMLNYKWGANPHSKDSEDAHGENPAHGQADHAIAAVRYPITWAEKAPSFHAAN